MSDVKQVKVDNWGIYFLQRLKHFFNRTDYCDLTLQFQDNAQLKVHRLVLSACTEYFELLERTCEMYEDCLVMPDDLQADVVVPIVNFMYTGHLEFRMDLLERLYQTSQILNMPVLTKLLESHRNLAPKAPAQSYSGVKRFTKHNESKSMKTSTPSASTSNKRSYSKAFENSLVKHTSSKTYQAVSKTGSVNNTTYRAPSPVSIDTFTAQKLVLADPRPTRYEIPEELDTDNVFDNSFCSISYTSQPLMVHPETVKRYKAKRSAVFGEASSSKKVSRMSTMDIVECKRIEPKEDPLFDDTISESNMNDETDLFSASFIDNEKDPNQLFDQILDPNDGPKVTIETKDSNTASNLDHARIISEVLKKYPHLVKSNKNIKLKILDQVPSKGKKHQKPPPKYVDEKPLKLKTEAEEDFTYETDVIDSKQAARLIAMGAENTKGPWICLICGTPGKALHFNSYYKFRRHLVEVHNEKPVSNICEYCGLRSLKRNYLLHHLYSQHGVPPPPQYHFPKCNQCSYIALTEGLLVKHKLTHKDIRNFRCNVCSSAFVSSNQLLIHIQNTGHKYCAEKKANLQCIYCLKVFLRETNLYAHIKTHHKKEAKNDCIIEDSDEETVEERPRAKTIIKFEPSTSYDNVYEGVDLQYQIQHRPTGDIQVVAKKHQNSMSNSKQKILNAGFDSPKPAQKAKPTKIVNHKQPMQTEFFQDIKMPIASNNQEQDEIVVIDNNEYIMRDHQLIPRKRKAGNRDYIMPDMMATASLQPVQQPTTSVEYANIESTNIQENLQQQSSMIIKKTANMNQPIQIVVSNEEEYKALMASNHPIIFDNSDANKTLTVLTAPHHNPSMETTDIDLDNTQSNEMMILPHEYPLNVSEAVPTENSNIVVVYSHPVDDPNKQYQILTTGGIGAQFVQSSAIITQNYETVTTTRPVMNAHGIETQVEQTWQNNIQSLQGQQIHLPPGAVLQHMVTTNHAEINQVHSETGNNLDELPVVHLVPEKQKVQHPEVSETDMTLNQSNVVNFEHVIQPIEHEVVEEQNNVPNASVIEKETTAASEQVEIIPQAKSMPDILNNTESINVIKEPMEIENVMEQPMETDSVLEQSMEGDNENEQSEVTENIMEQPMETDIVLEQSIEGDNVIEQPEVNENIMEQPLVDENAIEHSIGGDNVIEQPGVTENIIEQPVEVDNVMGKHMEAENSIEQPIGAENNIEQPMGAENNIKQPMVAEDVMEQPLENESVIEQALDTENTTEQPLETGNVIEQPGETENIMEQPLETENVIEQTMENVTEQPIEAEKIIEQTPYLQNEITTEQENFEDSATITKYSEVNNDIVDTPVDLQPELMESQAYDDIVVINRNNDEEQEPIIPKEAEAKIQNLTSEWSEDEYDVADNDNKIVSNENPPNSVLAAESPDLEESIENIQHEVEKQMAAPIEPDVETEESAHFSQEEDSSSQDMQQPPLNESTVDTVEQNPQAQQKISSLLNDWEDNDSQEEIITENDNVAVLIPVEANIDTTEVSEETANCLPVTTDESVKVLKNDNIKSLVSDWDDEEEDTKE